MLALGTLANCPQGQTCPQGPTTILSTLAFSTPYYHRPFAHYSLFLRTPNFLFIVYLSPLLRSFPQKTTHSALLSCLPCSCTFVYLCILLPHQTEYHQTRALPVAWHTVGAQFILLNGSIHLAALGRPSAGRRDFGERETDAPSLSDTEKLVSKARSWRECLAWMDPRPEEPRLVCALGEWTTVLSRRDALGLALTQEVGMMQKWSGKGCSAHKGPETHPWGEAGHRTTP